jgi:hypothetical protein
MQNLCESGSEIMTLTEYSLQLFFLDITQLPVLFKTQCLGD